MIGRSLAGEWDENRRAMETLAATIRYFETTRVAKKCGENQVKEVNITSVILWPA